ncbi:hypothetical protein HNR26_004521 [Rhizobium rosettiformans]|jgi:hypothetical protein|uniref:Uncharacterized protein n=1 Tax=Rhizobium rosettiformans TaxID=1368430 RepID=A0A7W8HUM9_9HYPH|nr:hypothetical protein [Rhizobium rosettiformans]MBB5278422.1 hypothetical protein [Rhizobium rosettiformans]
MEVIRADGQSTDWNETSATDEEAWEEFIYVSETEGISVFE